MPEPEERHAFDVAEVIALRGTNVWIGCVFSNAPDRAAVADLVLDLQAALGSGVRSVEVREDRIAELRDHLLSPEDDMVVLTGTDKLSERGWIALDVNRSGLMRSGALVWVLDISSLSLLPALAPNLRSFFGGSFYMATASGVKMNAQEITESLQALERRFGLSSEEVVRRAERKELPPYPEFAEWLIFLGRGDLVR